MDGRAWFIAGTVPLLLAGGAHALGALVDALRPTFFAPVDRALEPAMDATGLRFRRGAPRPTVWRAWVGFNLSHGLGVFAFGLLGLLLALDDPAALDAVRVPAIAVAAAYLAIAVRFWFWGPVLITGTATACFALSAL